MPRKSNSDYTVEIPVVIKDQTAKGARSANNTVDQMAKQAERDAARQASAAESLQRQRSAALLRQWKRDEDSKSRVVQQATKERERLEQQGAKAAESLQRQRSAALIAQWRREQAEFAKNERAKAAAAAKVAADIEASQDAMWTHLRNLAIAGVAAIAVVIAGLSVAIERAATFERLEQGLVAIMGSAGLAAQEIEKLKEVAKVPGLGFREAIQGSLSLQALGVQAERARKIIEAFGNAVAFTGGKNELDRILLQLTQMMSAGKVIMQDLRPIIQTAPIAGRALKDVFGTIEPKKLEEMTGNIDEFVDRWVAGLEKLPKAPNAAANSFENLGDTWDRFLIAIGKPFLPGVSKALETLTVLLDKGGETLGKILTALLKYPGVLATLTAAVTALGLALLFASTNAIPLLLTNLTALAQGFVGLIGTLRLVGQVMAGTASLIQGAAATTAVAAAGWIGLALAVGGLIYWLTKQKDIQEQVNEITVEQIETNGESLKTNLELQESVKKIITGQQSSIEKHEALNDVLSKLDPTTKAYIESLIGEQEQVNALNKEIERNISLTKEVLQSQLRVSVAGVEQQLNEREAFQGVIEGFNAQIRQLQQQLSQAPEDERGGLRQRIFDLSQAVVDTNSKIEKINQTLTQNEIKMVATSRALGQTRDQFIALLQSSNITGDRFNVLLGVWDKFTSSTRKNTDALHDQADALSDVKRELDNILNTGTLEIDRQILDIVKNAKDANEARRMAQEAIKGGTRAFGGRWGGLGQDTRLRDLLEERRRIQEVEKAAREVFEPKPVSKSTIERGQRDQEMVRSMREVSNQLAEDFKEEFGRAMNFHFGQTPLHTKLNYRHEAAFDISEDPRSREGRFIMEWLQSQGINFRASLGREVSATTGKLISTGRHIHAGELSGPLGRALKINENLLSPQGLEKELERQQLVFAPWSGQMVTQEQFVKEATTNYRKNLVLSPTGRQVTPQELTEEQESTLAELPLELSRKWDDYYEHIKGNEKQLNDRRRDFAEEYKLNQSNLITELGNLELDLEHFRKQAQDDQLTQQRRLLETRREEMDLLRAIRQEEDRAATDEANAGLRIQLALLQDLNDFRRRDEEAIKDYNRAQLELADATTYHAQQADTAVARFLADQKSITEIVAEAKIGVMETTFDVIDRGLEKVTDKLGIMKDLVKDILSNFIRLALSQFFRTVFLGQGAGGNAAGGGGGGGGGGIFGNLLGIGGGAQGGQANIANIPGVIQNLIGTGGVPSAPASVSQGGGGWGQLAKNFPNVFPGAGGTGGILQNTSRFGTLAPMLPLLGAGIGANLGGQSRFGQILGTAGGALAGLVGIAVAPTSIGGLGAGLAGLSALGIAAAFAAPALILGAILLGRNAEKRRNETAREALSQETVAALQGMLSEAESGNLTASQASAQFEELRVRYFQAITNYDSKTKRIATDWWNKPEHPPQVYWKKIQEAAKVNEQAPNIRARMSPVFAGGGWSSKDQLIKVRPGEGIKYPNSNEIVVVSGRDLGYDTEYKFVPRGTRILNQSEMKSAQPMQTGGIVGRGSGPGPGQDLPDLHIEELSIEIDADGMAKVVISSPFFKKAVINKVRLGKKEGKLA